MPAHDLLDGLAGLVGVVERDRRHVVVQHVRLDDAVQELPSDEAEFTVDGGRGAADVVPRLAGVVGKRGVGVLQESDGDCWVRSGQPGFFHIIFFLYWFLFRLTEPVVHPEIGNEVPDEHVGPAEGVAEVDEGSGSQANAQVAQQDQLGVLGLVQGAAGVVVVNAGEEAVLLALAATLTLALVVVVAGDVGQEVVGPADELLADQVNQGDDGGLLPELGQLVGQLPHAARLLLAGLGDEDHVALHVTGGLVVLAVGDLPAEVGDQQGRMQNPTDGVVQNLGGAEGLMTALVSKNPGAGAEEALHEGV